MFPKKYFDLKEERVHEFDVFTIKCQEIFDGKIQLSKDGEVNEVISSYTFNIRITKERETKYIILYRVT